MKKLLTVLCCLAALALVSCGAATFQYMKEDLTPYVTVGEYKNLTVTVPAVAEITDAEVEAQIESEVGYEAASTELVAVDRAAAEGDTVSIDYVGKIDGVAFESGTGSTDSLVLGSGAMISGFEDGIVGMVAGETKVVDATFPENYGNEELNGKTAQFEITLHGIFEETEVENEAFVLTDEIAQEHDHDSAEAYRAAVRAELEETRDASAKADRYRAAWTAVVNNCTVEKLPEDYIKSRAKDLYDYYTAMYYQYGIKPDQLGVTLEHCVEDVEQTVKEELCLYAIVKDGGYTISEEAYTEKVAAEAAENNVDVATYEKRVSRQSTETGMYYDLVMADIVESTTFVEE
ncbi:MAG: trigger factor [Clostridia bacterium]|nr:trigger factor [Clostridia bacterium]